MLNSDNDGVAFAVLAVEFLCGCRPIVQGQGVCAAGDATCYLICRVSCERNSVLRNRAGMTIVRCIVSGAEFRVVQKDGRAATHILIGINVSNVYVDIITLIGVDTDGVMVYEKFVKALPVPGEYCILEVGGD